MSQRRAVLFSLAGALLLAPTAHASVTRFCWYELTDGGNAGAFPGAVDGGEPGRILADDLAPELSELALVDGGVEPLVKRCPLGECGCSCSSAGAPGAAALVLLLRQLLCPRRRAACVG